VSDAGWLGALELLTLAALGFGALAALGCTLAWPALRGPLRRLEPASRARWLVGLAAAPLALAPLLVVLCLVPSLLGALGLGTDHCTGHPAHPHLCLAHRPPFAGGPWPVVALAAWLPLAAAAALASHGALRSRRVAASLEIGATRRLRDDVRLVETAAPVSFTAGLWRPRIYVSDTLARALAPAQLDALIEHERAHARRRDGLRQLAARALAVAQLPPTRRSLLAELELAREQICDAGAATRVGDPLCVAEALLAAERLLAASGTGVERSEACAFGASSIQERVARLLREPAPQAPPRPLRRLGAAAVGFGFALALGDPLHHLAEHCLAWLIG
jgi:Zn-dependent protease with chaperone function